MCDSTWVGGNCYLRRLHFSRLGHSRRAGKGGGSGTLSKGVTVRTPQQTSTCCDAGEGLVVGASGGHDDDLHVAAEGVQEPKQPVDRETFELPTHEGRNLGL